MDRQKPSKSRRALTLVVLVHLERTPVTRDTKQNRAVCSWSGAMLALKQMPSCLLPFWNHSALLHINSWLHPECSTATPTASACS